MYDFHTLPLIAALDAEVSALRIEAVRGRIEAMQYVDESARRKYLEALARTGLLGRSADGTGYRPGAFRELRKVDADFEEQVQESLQLYGECLEAELHRRGVEGWDEPVYQKGDHVGDVRRFSDACLLAKTKKCVRGYGDRTELDVKVQGGVLVVGAPAGDAAAWAAKFAPTDDSAK